MIELEPEAMARAMGATIVARGADGFPRAAAIDSREVAGGELFFGLAGESDDGGAFARAAIESGAWGVVVTPEWAERLTDGPTREGRPEGDERPDGDRQAWILADPDPLGALQSLAREWRRELGATVIGITGSVGKTSVKDITRALLPGRVHASKENFNTEIGLPLTILAAPVDTDFLVLEMAMRGRDQIAELAEIAEPDVGVITNVGPVHVELLGSVEEVAAAKAELIEGLGVDGALIVQVDAGALERHLMAAPGLIRFGEGGDVAATDVTTWPDRVTATVTTPEGSHAFEFPFPEAHNLSNALAAIAAGVAAGVSLPELAGNTGRIAFSSLRGERIDLGERGLVINDCYNANPVSMEAALEHLAGLEGRRIAVLGIMAELGPEQDRYHEEIGVLARELGIETVIGVGPVAIRYRPDHWAEDTAEAAQAVEPLLGPDATVLVKGSRSAGLEDVAVRLAGSGPAGSGSADRDTVR